MLRGVFEKLAQPDLNLKPSKCKLFKAQISYSGPVVTNGGI